MRNVLVLAVLAAMGWCLSSCEMPGDEPTITGTITYRGEALPGLAAWVLAGEINTPDSLIVEPAEVDGTYVFRGEQGGEYEVFGVVDVDGDGSPGGGWYDVMGHHPDMPVTVPAEGLEGIDVNVNSAYAWTASCFDGDDAYLVGIGARVLDGQGNDLAGDVLVSVTGGSEVIVLDEEALAREWVPYCSGGVPMDGPTDYTFTVSHPDHYDPSESFTVTNTPRSDHPIIDSPQEGDSSPVGTAVTVEWTSTGEPSEMAWVQLWWRGEDAGDEPIWEEMVAGPSVEVPAGALGEAGPYSVIVLQADESYYPEGGTSQAWGLDEVFFSVAR